MTEITIKGYSRKSRKGNLVKVNSYKRRVGKKGVISPKRTNAQVKTTPTASAPGAELKAKLSPEELARRRAWDAAARKSSMSAYGGRAESKEEWQRRIQREEDDRKSNEIPGYKPKYREAPSPKKVEKRKSDIFSRIEDKISRFTEKYGKKKYKRYL